MCFVMHREVTSTVSHPTTRQISASGASEAGLKGQVPRLASTGRLRRGLIATWYRRGVDRLDAQERVRSQPDLPPEAAVTLTQLRRSGTFV